MVLNLIFVGCPCFYEFYNNLVYRLQYVFSGFRYSSLVLVNYIVFCIILLHANILFTLYSFARFNPLVFPVYFWFVLFHCCCIADGFEFQINCSGKSLNPSRSCRWLPRPVTNTLSISAKLIITLLTLWTNTICLLPFNRNLSLWPLYKLLFTYSK